METNIWIDLGGPILSFIKRSQRQVYGDNRPLGLVKKVHGPDNRIEKLQAEEFEKPGRLFRKLRIVCCGAPAVAPTSSAGRHQPG